MTSPSIESGARERTRRAILDAAMLVLADHPTAALGDIAAAAGVGRSTVHRYYPERTDLLRALARHVHDLSNAAIERADPTSGPVDAALRRVVESQLDLGPIVLFVYYEPSILADPELAAYFDIGDEGHRRGAQPRVDREARISPRVGATGVLGTDAGRL